MTTKASMDVLYRVVDEEEGACLEVLRNPDFPEGSILIRTPDKKSAEWWGAVELSMSYEFAAMLATALARATTPD